MNKISNPILKGFNPDPSIVRAGEDYYIATSTFQWFPGVQIHHSRDLVNWELIAHPVNRLSQLDMRGRDNNGGIWAPCLSYDNGIFYLIYSDMRSFKGPWMDSHNFLITCDKIDGNWSDPIYMNCSGFDASLFHDNDGRKWFLNMTKDHRNGHNSFGGIVLQEYDPKEKKLTGPITNIFKGSEIALTEGSHLYQKDGWYYLTCAEGGTGYEHAQTFARAKKIEGPYEIHPDNPVLTAVHDRTAPLQKTGHGSMVETPDGQWYLTHLTSRPLENGRCILCRETAIQKIDWPKGEWPTLAHGTKLGLLEVEPPKASQQLESANTTTKEFIDDFTDDKLNIHWQTLRIPMTKSQYSLTERDSHLRLNGAESLDSFYYQSFIARRQQAFSFDVETKIDFKPSSFKQMAGLIYYYDTQHYYYLMITHHETDGRCITLVKRDMDEYIELVTPFIPLPNDCEIYMKLNVINEKAVFSFSTDNKTFKQIGPEVDSTILSDDYINWGFTGPFIGLCCQDLNGTKIPADFDYFKYTEK